MMRFRVRSGMDCEAAELLSTAETVPGVNPRCSATAFNVTWFSRLRGARLPFIFEAEPGAHDASGLVPRRIVSQLGRGIEECKRPAGPTGPPGTFNNIVIFCLTEAGGVALNLDRIVRLFDASPKRSYPRRRGLRAKRPRRSFQALPKSSCAVGCLPPSRLATSGSP